VGAGRVATVTVRVVALEPKAFWTVSETVRAPAVANACVGFGSEDALAAPEAGSPKLQLQDVGPPVEASVKLTVWPTSGDGGEKANAAVGAKPAGETMMMRDNPVEPEEFPAVNVTR
jgi:hypothetical protein